MQGNNALDLFKQLAAASLNVQWYSTSRCGLPTGNDLMKKPPFSSIAAAIEKGNSLLGQRRLPRGVCDCCAGGESCDGTVCPEKSGCDPLAASTEFTDVVSFLQAWNTFKSCGWVGGVTRMSGTEQSVIALLVLVPLRSRNRIADLISFCILVA